MAIGTPGGTRTPDPLLRRQPLCPLSYRRKSHRDLTRQPEAYHRAGRQESSVQSRSTRAPAKRVNASMLESLKTMNTHYFCENQR